MKNFEITVNEAGQRFDKYLNKLLCKAPKGFVYKMLRKKNIVLNSKKAVGTEILKTGDSINLYLSDETFEKFTEINRISKIEKASARIKPDIVFEDENILVVNKPAGILSQKACDNDISMNEVCLNYLISKNEISNESLIGYKPSVVNRLDRNTEGLLLFAKTLTASQQLSKALKERTIQKYYRCIVIGDFKTKIREKAYLTKDTKTNKVSVSKVKDNDKATLIETEFNPVATKDGLTLLEIDLLTGKSHQIRAHISYLGYPILGDTKYGKSSINDEYRKKYGINHQLLCACRIIMPDNMTGSMEKLNSKIIEIVPEGIEKIFGRQ